MEKKIVFFCRGWSGVFHFRIGRFYIFFIWGFSYLFLHGNYKFGIFSFVNRKSSHVFYIYVFRFIVCTISALLFKLGAAPYHMWIADVYEGAPTIVSLVFAVVPKIEVFVVILRLFFLRFWSFFPVFWEDFFCWCGLLILFIGCLCGLGETKIKRLLPLVVLATLVFFV